MGKIQKFPDGSSPFISHELSASASILKELDYLIGEPGSFEDNNVIAILDFYKNKYTLSLLFFTVDYDCYIYRKFFSSFDALIKGASRVSNLINIFPVEEVVELSDPTPLKRIMPEVTKSDEVSLTSDELADVVYGFITLIEQRIGYRIANLDRKFENLIHVNLSKQQLALEDPQGGKIYEILTDIAHELEQDDKRLFIEVYGQTKAGIQIGYDVEILTQN